MEALVIITLSVAAGALIAVLYWEATEMKDKYEKTLTELEEERARWRR